MLSTQIQVGETVEAVLHRILKPIVEKHGESRLQKLADMYRNLTPTDQIEAIKLLRDWQLSKVIK